MPKCDTCKANKVCDHNIYGFENCGNYIPGEDVEEVVRCKDCAHWGGVTFGFICRFADISKMYSEIKSEVIKEFAEMLKGKATTPIGTLYGEMIHIDDIDNLVKEMKEENNAKEI